MRPVGQLLYRDCQLCEQEGDEDKAEECEQAECDEAQRRDSERAGDASALQPVDNRLHEEGDEERLQHGGHEACAGRQELAAEVERDEPEEEAGEALHVGSEGGALAAV